MSCSRTQHGDPSGARTPNYHGKQINHGLVLSLVEHHRTKQDEKTPVTVTAHEIMLLVI